MANSNKPSDLKAALTAILAELDRSGYGARFSLRLDRIELGVPGRFENQQCRGACGIPHPPVYLWDRTSCEGCCGGDDFAGRDFCPVGDYCCGC